ncbi:SDR family oxidoreductase [Salinisphaera orenii]|uniref:Cell-cell signaling protein, C-factor n=1 Tax=Salinisphaera orenii YIM 95161 TaxID=1051139 RepID=A0A423Q6C4_9GAMM|nr:SDR family oxidoreductase [Salinisphaera halophila]ROO35190.1 cell-cell signaling protein, C-factor [Salinisphaera halophila YIM 95161]
MNILIQGAGRGLGLALATRLLERDAVRLVATVRDPSAAPRLQALAEAHGDTRLRIVALDVTSETSVADARARIGHTVERLDGMLVLAGLLHDERTGLWPEKRLADIDPAHIATSFAVNATGPLLMIKHFHDLLAHGERAVIASLSARVGSIGDNHIGGWYAYRAAKAAQNQFTRTAAIELRRRSRALICVGLHPGTVDTGLSEPFQRRVPAGRLQSPDTAARHLLAVIDRLTPEDSGHVFDWAGERIEP